MNTSLISVLKDMKDRKYDKYIHHAKSFANTYLSTDGFLFWFLILILIIFILWLFFGGGDYEYIGLSPMDIGVDSTKYINPHISSIITKSNINAPGFIENKTNPDICFCKNKYNNKYNNKYTDECIKKALGPYKPYNVTNISKGEQKCKQIIENIYNVPFFCIRPDFLKNPTTNRNLELDLYNDELKIAIEHNGIQHYEWPNYTGQSKKKFIKQLQRDRFKAEQCNANGIYLIQVPYTIPHNKLEKYIISKLPPIDHF